MSAVHRHHGTVLEAGCGCQVVQTLSWAVDHSIPFDEAVRTLIHQYNPKRRRVSSSIWSLPVIGWVLAPLGVNRAYYVYCLNRLVKALDDGMSLGAALDMTMGRVVPRYAVRAIHEADGEGRLPEALSILAERMRFGRVRDRSMLAIVVLFLMYSGSFFCITTFLMIFVVPKYAKIFNEMTGGALPESTQLLIGSADMAIRTQIIMLYPFILIFAIACLGFRLGGFDRVISRLPVLGRRVRELRTFDAMQCIAANLAMGADVAVAATKAHASSDDRWLRRKLKAFTAAVESGAPWQDAWTEQKIGTPMHRWLIENSAARQDPASGFAQVAETMYDGIDMQTRRIASWAPAVCSLFHGVIVAFIVYALFAPLVSLITIMG
jgi:type II secretory pathway component PulF